MIHRSTVQLLFAWLMLAVSFCAHAQLSADANSTQPAVLLSDSQDHVSLRGFMQALEDPSGKLSINDVASAPMRTLLGDSLAFGYTRSVVWLRLMLQLPQNAVDTDWRLEVDNVTAKDVQFYLRRTGGAWEEQRAGRVYAHEKWPLKTRVPVFKLSLQPGSHEVLLRIASDHTVTGGVRLWSARNFADHAINEALGFGAYFGAIVCALLLQLFFWFVGKEQRFGWYVSYTVVLSFAVFLNTGYFQNAFDVGGNVPLALLGAYICLVPALGTRMAVVWMDMDAAAPKLSLVLQLASYGVCGGTAMMALMGHYTLGLQLNQMGTLIWTLASIAFAVYTWRVNHSMRGLTYLAVFSFLDAGLFIRFARNIALIPSSPWTDDALSIGVVLHLIAMSLYFMYAYSSLREALQIEQRAREEQREFVNMVSHEFRTPLAIISTSAQQIAANPTATIERVQQRTKNIRDAIHRMDRLLSEYLSLDRLDSTSQGVVLLSGDFYEVIEAATADWDLGKVRVSIDDLPTPFVCDHGLMRIVLRNLLANSVRHSPDGSTVDLRVMGTPERGMHIEVEDRGCGLDPGELSMLFQKYFRGKAAQNKPGAGLGLYLAKRIVEQHSGTISAASAPGQGTVFVIELPGDLAAESSRSRYPA